jgi:hypothetical protein
VGNHPATGTGLSPTLSEFDMGDTFKVLFINGDGSGFSDYVDVTPGTTAGDFFKQRMGGEANPAGYTIRMTRDGVKNVPASGELLRAGDRVSIAPNKVQGA